VVVLPKLTRLTLEHQAASAEDGPQKLKENQAPDRKRIPCPALALGLVRVEGLSGRAVEHRSGPCSLLRCLIDESAEAAEPVTTNPRDTRWGEFRLLWQKEKPPRSLSHRVLGWRLHVQHIGAEEA
jgi:hypothetical protein